MRFECKKSAASPIWMSNLRIAGGDVLVLVRLHRGAPPSLLIVAALEARNYDRLGEHNLSAEKVATVQGRDARATRIALDGLVGLDVLSKVKEGRCRNTPTSLHHFCVKAEGAHAIEGRVSATSMEPR